MDENALKAMDWSFSDQHLASVNAYNPGHEPILPRPMKDDMHSFTRGRNLVDHKVRGKKENAQHSGSFAEGDARSSAAR